MNRYEFEVRYSEAQIRRSTWAFIRITLLHRPVIWVIPSMFGTVALMLGVSWQTYIRNSLQRLSRMKSPVAKVVLDDDKLALSSDLGSSIVPWSTFTESIDGPEAIYLKAGKGAMINLPIGGVDSRALQFMRDRIAAQSPRGD